MRGGGVSCQGLGIGPDRAAAQNRGLLRFGALMRDYEYDSLARFVCDNWKLVVECSLFRNLINHSILIASFPKCF